MATDRKSYTRDCLRASRVRNRAYVAEINARTFCAHCGEQPIEWHNPEHVELSRQRYRISDMVNTARSIAAIVAEMARCTPLCRRCHMAEDGRLSTSIENLVKARHARRSVPLPCLECKETRMLYARGLCKRCYRHQPEQRAQSNYREREKRAELALRGAQ